jgi:hypothetical protein
MKLLAEITPTETLLLLDGSKTEFRDLLKYTLMDLCLKRVLEVKETTKEYRTSRSVRYRVIKYVVKGKQFDQYTPKAFELVYLVPFQKSPDLKVIFSKLVKVAYDSVKLEHQYRSLILQDSQIACLISKNLVQKLFFGFSLNKKGELARKEIVSLLKSVDNQIAKLLASDPKAALEILLTLGGNLFLLKNIDFSLLRNIDQALLDATKMEGNYRFSHDSSWVFYDLAFNVFFENGVDFFDSFDSFFDSAGCSSHDSGCSSCGGCSGCGGCS